MIPASDFEAARPQLTAIAFRLLGSIHDAEDAVQTTWIKVSNGETEHLRRPAAWLTTVLGNVCLDQLRARRRRREETLPADEVHAEELAADERYLQRESVSRALMIVLNALTPPQRIAYVLHDLFDVPFQEIAAVLDTSRDNAKKHASRARRRIAQNTSVPASDADGALVDAFLSAAAGGDMTRMLDLMAPDCARTVDPSLSPTPTAAVVRGRAAVADETRTFVDRIRTSTVLLIGGRATHVIAPGGHPIATIDVATRNGLISRIDVRDLRGRPLLAGAGSGSMKT
ncbi:sigma-70 family RNA polymerase sigma factor [Tsukamurella sp. 8F]|uniref:sigma-70 family RNA polymerase sigma factor n=1 Tax=unclassified Tsukamurella TaxID=2633480 RepID=UPI0023B95E60|nr:MULTISPECIES: sigma-70 family RNA polymerase sigma factor [unclassified Tsukamurella]MDF0528706.1 sigma-70 family RNA polymerase sigma factor [Tsukamurella sp. 8J]MDF0585668.1 sigma-70 family RNA polymerase sigma factor [Tsukamurella sp. 8F]